MSDDKLADELNAVTVTVGDLILAAKEVHKLTLEEDDDEGRLIAVAHLFKDTPNKALAVEQRLIAMASMLDAGVLPGWTTPVAADGSVRIAQEVLKATATEPLIFNESQAHFDAARFSARVLSLAEPEGRA